ncbi:MAG: zf-HC2 domain-containing protein [Bacteroidetes bacterium]|nr:zf-HC2 domain-containing protein [Bacteroidota bacterium]
MNCSQVQEYFDEFYSNELNPETKNLVQKHLDDCKECASEYSAFVLLKEKAKSLRKEILPPKQIFANIENEIKMKNDIKITPLSNNILTIDFHEDKKEVLKTQPAGFMGRNWYWFASAAVILLIVSISIAKFSSKSVYSVEEMSNWKLVSLKGGAFVNGVKSDVVNVGDWIQTDSVSSVILKIANVGDVSIEPNTKVRFIQSDNNISRIEVVYGTVNTSTSQADKFVLQSSNMKVQDKGGSYSFKVDDKGNGVIYVNNGIANVESGNKSSVVTDGKFCLYKPEYGVGIPFRKDSKPEFQNALFNYDFNNGGTPSVYYAIANAMPEDYSSLLNLIPRVDDKTKYLVYNKLSKLAPQAIPTINIDSLDEYDDEDIENSLKDMKENMHNKLKVELNFNKDELAKEMEELSRDLAEMKINIKIDGKKMAEDIKREMQNLKIELADMHDYMPDTNEMKIYMKEFNSEEFKKDMEKMKIELKENLGKMDEEMKKSAEEWKKDAEEWKKHGEEWKKEAEEWKKEFSPDKFNFNFNFDSLHINIEGLEDLEQLKELENFNDMKIDTANGKHKFYFKFDDKKHKKDKKDKKKDDTEDNDDDSSEEI